MTSKHNHLTKYQDRCSSANPSPCKWCAEYWKNEEELNEAELTYSRRLDF